VKGLPAQSPKSSYVLDTVLIFAFVAFLILPLFRVKYLDVWSSIESTFIADARFLSDHWPHPNWQPNWYCGTRTDYIYPPALRYGTAALVRYVPRMIPARAYHLYVAFFYCFGIAVVYLLARWASGSRGAGWLAAVATALVSPSFLFVQSIRDDTPLWMPYRLSVLMRYGEGPHMTALAWIPLALLCSFIALVRWRPIFLAAAAVCCAMVVSNNFYGATSLAILYPLLVWSVYVTREDRWIWVRGAAIPALAYGLCAFWLVPSYLRLTLENMRFVSSEGNLWSRWVALGFVVGFVLLTDHLARGKKEQTYFVFLCGAVAAFVLNVLGNHFLNFRLLGEPARLFPELDLLFILLVTELLRRLWHMDARWVIGRRVAAGLIVAAGLAPSYEYVSQARSIFVRYPTYEDRVEFQLQDWMAKNMPDARALTSGSVRFWYNVWHDLPQLGGGSEQGLLNPHIQPPQWEIFLGPNADMSILWLKLLGVDAVIVNGKESRELYHDHQYPEKFKGVLPVLHDNGSGDVIYGVPRRYRSLARVVDRARHQALPEIPGNGQMPELTAWHDVVENGPDTPTETRWDGTDVIHVKASVQEGQSVWLQVSYDSNWEAYTNGQQIPVRMDKLGFTVVDAPPGNHDISMVFPTPFSAIAGRTVTVLSMALVFGLVWWERRLER
jgi:hypothetical protein